jgi:hypothetical protein
MKYYLIIFITLLMVGCASDPANRAAVANEEVSILAPPSKALSEFSHYELKPLAMSEPVKADEDKVKVSKELEAKLIARINPLLSEWRGKKGNTDAKSVLIIEPIVQKLRVISGGTRFWAGALVGESFIELDLKLTDSATGQLIAVPRVHQSAGAMAGAWSYGSTDRNLLDYVTDIAYRYLEVNYSK